MEKVVYQFIAGGGAGDIHFILQGVGGIFSAYLEIHEGVGGPGGA